MHHSGHHRSVFPIARILCLALIAVMLAQPVTAAVSAPAGCGEACCCCPAPDQDAVSKIRGGRVTVSDCCGSDGAAADCRMAPMERPAYLPALIRTASPSPTDTGSSLPAACQALYHPDAAIQTVFRADTESRAAAPPLYLRTCRLIC